MLHITGQRVNPGKTWVALAVYQAVFKKFPVVQNLIFPGRVENEHCRFLIARIPYDTVIYPPKGFSAMRTFGEIITFLV